MKDKQSTDKSNTTNRGQTVDKNTSDIVWVAPNNTLKNNKTRELTHKQREFIRGIIDDKLTKTDAYLQAYNHKGSKKSAYEIAHHTSRSPQVRIELAKHTDNMKLALLEVVDKSRDRLDGSNDRDYSNIASVIERTSNSIIDRVEGKAKQTTEVINKSVSVNIDLTTG